MSDTEEEQAIVSLASAYIAAQIELAEAGSWWRGPGRYRRARDAFARGYIMGFCDAIFQSKGINDDDVRCVALSSLVLIRLSGMNAGSKLAGEALREMGRGASHVGQKCGLQDFTDWRRASASSDKPPLPSALFHHIMGR